MYFAPLIVTLNVLVGIQRLQLEGDILPVFDVLYQ